MKLMGNAGYGNDELVMDFEGIYSAAGHMLEWQEITEEAIEAGTVPLVLLRKTHCCCVNL